MKITKFINKNKNKIYLTLQLLLIIISLLIILFYEKLFPSFKLTESFITVDKFLEGDNINNYNKTIFETSILDHSFINKSPDLICNLLPILDCPNRRNYPVHIIKTINGDFIAVFNDGQLYTNNNIKQNVWSGPLNNSLINRDTPLRMITTTPEGHELIGIGYDNKVYIKRSPDKILDLEVEWQLYEDIKENQNIIYLLYHKEENNNLSNNKIKKIIVNVDGKIMLEDDNGNFVDVLNISNKFIKLYFDTNGYMLAIDNNFRLGTFDDKNWLNSKYSVKYPVNNYNYLIDIIYDTDNKLFGLTFDFINGNIDLKKQPEIGYNNKFVTIDKTAEQANNILTTRDIIASKLGNESALGNVKASELLFDQNVEIDNDIEMARQRQSLEDIAEIKQLCKKRMDVLDTNFIDIELNKELVKNQKLIEEANKKIAELII